MSVVNFITGPLNDFAWIYVLLTFTIIGGIYLSVGNKFVQFKRFGYAMKHTLLKMFKKTDIDEGAVSPFQAATTALSATVGTGNIVGTSQAIAMGGYGAIFWMWIFAFVGMAIKYSEVTLSVKFRERNADGDYVGGPMYYIKNGLGKNWNILAIIYCILTALAAFGIGNLSQANSISGSIVDAIVIFNPQASDNRFLITLIVGIVLAVSTALVLFGGIKRIGKVTEKLIPFMAALYILFTLIVIFGNITNVGHAFSLIFKAAFNPKAVMGGAFGIAIKETLIWSLRRSAFSNEAGLGTAAIAHAAADNKSPVHQGMYGIFEVFMDTIVICTLTALTIIISGVNVTFGVKPGSALITSAFATIFGSKIAALFVAIAMMLFAYSTILGWSLYGTRCVQYIFGLKATKVYQFIFILIIIVGATAELSVVWNIADTLNGLMAIPNFIALFFLSPVIFKITKEHFNKVDSGIEE